VSLLAAQFAFPQWALAQQVAFQAPPALQVDHRPVSVALRDLDGDTDLDLLVLNTGEFSGDLWVGSSFDVYLNERGFHRPLIQVTADAPHGWAFGDLNGDGREDLATADTGADQLALWLSKGDGRFAPGAEVPVGRDPVAVVAADLNGDGEPDLASADQFEFGVSVALNLGQGVAFEVSGYLLGDLTNGIQAGDVDGDADLDLIITAGDHTWWLRNLGQGSFTPQALSTGPLSSNLRLLDLDGDGALDLVTGAQVWWGRGDGTYEAQPTLTGMENAPLDVADFDGDGRLDLVTTAAWAAGVERRGFRAPVGLDPPADAGAIVIGDYSGDGLADLVRLQGGVAGPKGYAVLLEARQPGVLASAPRYSGGDSVWRVNAGRMDGDDAVDLVVANIGTPWGQFENGSAVVLRGDGTGGFAAPLTIPAGDYVREVAVIDLDRDTCPDLAATNFSDAGVTLLVQGSGVSTAAAGDNPESMAYADFDGDGVVDLVVSNYRLGTEPGMVSLLLGRGDGDFEEPRHFVLSLDRPDRIAAGDLNRDGNADLVVGCAGRYWSGHFIGYGFEVMLGDGAGGFLSSTAFTTPPYPRGLALADLNRDQIPDLVLGTVEIGTVNSGQLLVYPGDGSGGFGTPWSVACAHDHFHLVCRDLNGDGIADLVLPDGGSHAISVFPGVGNGTLGTPVHFATTTKPRDLVAADFNGDGRLDLATAHADSNQVGVLLAAPGSSISLTAPFPGVAGESNQVEAFGAAPGATVWFYYGLATGKEEVTGCSDLQLYLQAPVAIGSAVADAAGHAAITARVAAAASGVEVLLQAVERDSCVASSVVSHQFE
jgi:hypothetical protein